MALFATCSSMVSVRGFGCLPQLMEIGMHVSCVLLRSLSPLKRRSQSLNLFNRHGHVICVTEIAVFGLKTRL